MRKTPFLLILLVSATFMLSGCGSILMPYKDEFRCNKGVGSGYCSSMSDNYDAIQANNNVNASLKTKSASNVKNDETPSVDKKENIDNTCKKCEDVNEAIWLKQRALEKQYGIK